MAKTTNETMDDVFEHLERLVNAGSHDLHAYTKAGIIEKLRGIDESTVSKALEKLEENEDIESKRIGVMIYLPRSDQARSVHTRMIDLGYETMRPYLASLLGMGVVYLIMVGFGGPASGSPLGAWQDGFAQAAVLGTAVGAFIQKILTRLACWKARSHDDLATIIQLTTISVLVGGLLVGAYHVGISHFDREFDPGVGIALLSLAFAVTIGYASYLKARTGKVIDSVDQQLAVSEE